MEQQQLSMRLWKAIDTEVLKKMICGVLAYVSVSVIKM